MDAMNNDLDTPAALAVMHEMLGSKLSDDEKRAHLLSFDVLLGLGFMEVIHTSEFIPPAEIAIPFEGTAMSAETLLAQRNEARESKDWNRADSIRNAFTHAGYEVVDSARGVQLRKK
jgi:cysteinyl-tRNA synthetase